MRQILDMPTSLDSENPSTCGFVAKIGFCSEVSNFSQHFQNDDFASGFYQQRRHPQQYPVVAETSKGRCRKTEQRPFFVIASHRVHDGCITDCAIPYMRSDCAAEQENHAANFYSESILNHARITSSARLLAFAHRIVLHSKSIQVAACPYRMLLSATSIPNASKLTRPDICSKVSLKASEVKRPST